MGAGVGTCCDCNNACNCCCKLCVGWSVGEIIVSAGGVQQAFPLLQHLTLNCFTSSATACAFAVCSSSAFRIELCFCFKAKDRPVLRPLFRLVKPSRGRASRLGSWLGVGAGFGVGLAVDGACIIENISCIVCVCVCSP